MAYNPFPVGYQPTQFYYPQQQQAQQPQPQPAQQSNGIIWVQGEAGAKSYLVAPNTTVQLWDSESDVIYLKSADASGMPSMKVIDYKVRNSASEQSHSVSQQVSYATKDDVNMLQSEIDKLRNEMKGMMNNEQPVISGDDGRTA